MFTNVVLASAALMASVALAQSVGSAVVVNQCSYQVYIANTPAADGGYNPITEWLDSGSSYTQQWTQLSNGDGWSIKLSMSTDLSDIMQYEYTYVDNGQDIIWYDLSDVNGNPWNANWEITATSASGACDPKQQAYRYATDDAYGMQACPSDSIITVTLCSGDSSDDGAAASASSSVAAKTSSESTETSTFTTPTQSAPTQYTAVTSTSVATSSVETTPSSSSVASTPSSTSVESSPSTTVQSTTFVTSTAKVYTPYSGVTYTAEETVTQTDAVTQTYYHHGGKRHEHHRRHHVDTS